MHPRLAGSGHPVPRETRARQRLDPVIAYRLRLAFDHARPVSAHHERETLLHRPRQRSCWSKAAEGVYGFACRRNRAQAWMRRHQRQRDEQNAPALAPVVLEASIRHPRVGSLLVFQPLQGHSSQQAPRYMAGYWSQAGAGLPLAAAGSERRIAGSQILQCGGSPRRRSRTWPRRYRRPRGPAPPPMDGRRGSMPMLDAEPFW